MRILTVVEKEGSAIYRMMLGLKKYCNWHDIQIVAVHPKRPNLQQLTDFQKGMEWCDIINFQYWKTAEMLRAMYNIAKPCLLAHHNPYDLNQSTWTNYKVNVVHNSEQQKTIRVPSVKIEHPVDLEYWEFQQKEKENPSFDIIMVQGRIEAKKGALAVAQASKDLGLKVALVGSVSDQNYMDQIMETGVVKFFENISDDALRDMYHDSKIHVCNSIDKFESGTLPILEAMACGTPVLTRKIGHVPDLFNGKNMLVRRGEVEDLEDLKNQLKVILDDKELRDEMRIEARHSLRYRNYEIYSREYSKLFHHLNQSKELVTAIIPTVATPEQLVKILSRVMAQTYGPMEIIICDDSTNPHPNEELIRALRPQTNHTLKFYTTATYTSNLDEVKFDKTYGLARARNKAILEAEGKWLWFVDDRMLPEPTSLMEFYNRRKEGTWLWGMKDEIKKSFVENFSFCDRRDIIRIGGFNEQITQYGGMTQDIRTRWEANRLQLEFVENARAKTDRKSSAKWNRYMDIAKSKTQCYKLLS